MTFKWGMIGHAPKSQVWRVVVIEDNPDDRVEIRRLLLQGSERRYKFVEAETGAEGVRIVLDPTDGPPDCVVLDYSLPDTNAVEVLAALVGPDGLTVCAVVVLTGSTGHEQTRAVLRAGAQDYLGKGWMTAESLTRAVENAIERWELARELSGREALLRASEERLRLAVEASGTGLWSWDVETDAVTWSPECYPIHGVAVGAFDGTGAAFFRLVHPDDRARVEATVRQAIDSRTLYECDFRVVRPDGTAVWVANRGRCSYDSAGRPLRVLGTITDISDRKEAEDRLRASEEFNRSLMNGSSDCVKVLDLDGRLLTINGPGLCAMEIDDFTPLCGQEWMTLWPAETRPNIEQGLARVRGGDSYSFQAFCPTAKGTPRWWDVAVSPVRDGDGRVVRLLSVSRDMTERKRAEEAVRASEERLARAQRAASVGTWDWDITADQANWTAEAWQLFTASVDTDRPVNYNSWQACVHPDDRERAAAIVAAALVAGPYRDEFRVRYRDGREAWLESAGEVIRDEHGRAIRMLGTIRNITDRKQMEQALRDADRRKDEFLATLAHELRNPLAAARSAVKFLQMKGPAIPELQWARDIIDRQTQAMTRLIDDLMDVSRINQGKIDLQLEHVELAKIVQGAVETCRSLIEEMSHELTVTLPAGPVIVNADLTRLAQVIQNLLNNAAKYTERGGRIHLSAELQGSDVLVSVKDTGIGIPADKLAGIFEMFSQVQGALSRAQGGLGIGLSLVKRLVEMHSGSIEAKSDGPGKGSEVVVRLPIVVEKTYAHQASDDSDKSTPTSDLRILVVDDNKDNADVLAMLLKMMGNTIHTAYDGEEAVAAAREFRPHVVLCDIGLPKLNGYQACRLMKQQAWDVKMILIALTGWGQDDDRNKSAEAGFDHHLVKPVDTQALMNLLAGLETVKV